MDESSFESKKEWREERKRAQRTDRSKYKKTDQDKLQKVQDAHNEQLERSGHHVGRVLSITAQGITVDEAGHTYLCSLRRTLLQGRNRLKKIVTVGDLVYFDPIDETEGTIVNVKPRYSLLSRQDSRSRHKEQLVAANIDQVIITSSVVTPPLKVTLIDRYMIAARKGNMEPVILINKIDLVDDQTEVNEVVALYRSIGLKAVAISTKTGVGLDDLREVLNHKTSVFSGQSGVGKSSLINLLTGLDLKTGEVASKTGKGTHTTTTAKLVPLTCGGWCIDTPGIQAFSLWELDKDDLVDFFPRADCRFPNCTHTHEPGCVVKELVEKGEIPRMRYDSYLNLFAEL